MLLFKTGINSFYTGASVLALSASLQPFLVSPAQWISADFRVYLKGLKLRSINCHPADIFPPSSKVLFYCVSIVKVSVVSRGPASVCHSVNSNTIDDKCQNNQPFNIDRKLRHDSFDDQLFFVSNIIKKISRKNRLMNENMLVAALWKMSAATFV